MVSHLLHAWNLNLAYARRLVADLTEEQMTVQPSSGMNHAAWVLGHLACSGDTAIQPKQFVGTRTAADRSMPSLNSVSMPLVAVVSVELSTVTMSIGPSSG